MVVRAHMHYNQSQAKNNPNKNHDMAIAHSPLALLPLATTNTAASVGAATFRCGGLGDRPSRWHFHVNFTHDEMLARLL
jgi:hypothetical protein